MDAAPENEVAPVVAVGRTVGGIALVLIGLVVLLAGAFWFFLVPWFGWAMEGFWFQMAEWADLGGVAAMILGFLALIVGGALIQRARKRRLQIFAPVAVAEALAEADVEDERTGTAPPTIV